MKQTTLKVEQSLQVAFVAGATGFVGRFLIAELLQQGHQVFALLRNKAQQQRQLEDWLRNRNINLERFQCVQGDVTQVDLGIEKKSFNSNKFERFFHLSPRVFLERYFAFDAQVFLVLRSFLKFV